MRDAYDDYGVMFAAPVFATATACRAGAGYLGIWSSRAPRLVKLGFESWIRSPEEREGSLHEELVEFARESGELITRELERGIEDLEGFGQPRRAQGR
ncbi:MAG TPA: hypothetical protein VLZ06_09215 [Solirubrobacteraceae bacterium]|nr:hypothetical protein [Solirubrobacteraceae bacterium]